VGGYDGILAASLASPLLEHQVPPVVLQRTKIWPLVTHYWRIVSLETKRLPLPTASSFPQSFLFPNRVLTEEAGYLTS
jgi:hypothetical protein